MSGLKKILILGNIASEGLSLLQSKKELQIVQPFGRRCER